MQMDVRVLKSQNIFYKIDSGVAALLIDAGICEQFVPAPPKPAPKPQEWSVCIYPKTGEYYIRHVVGLTTEEFKGEVSAAKNAFKSVRWNPESQKRELMGPDTPDWVIAKLAALRGQPLAAQVQRVPKF
jgi:hypothetical protein